jgi:PAS domain S-box-containing protein
MQFDMSLIDRLGVPASLHDVDGRFIHMNATAERSAGFTMADMRGRRFTDPLPPEARESVKAHFDRALHGEPAEIANELTLSTETVRNHLRGLLRELDAHTRVEAIATAQRLGLLSSAPLRPKA